MVIVVAASLVLGALTSYAQGLLPGPLRPFANSASGWTVLTALIVWRIGERTLPSAVFGPGASSLSSSATPSPRNCAGSTTTRSLSQS